MNAARPAWWRIAALIMLAFAALGWFLYVALFGATWGQDWMVFDTAGKAYLRGDLGLLLNGPRFTAALNASHPSLAVPLRFHPWVYPPYTLLLAVPFALLPWWANYGVFQSLSLAGLVLALRLRARGARLGVLLLGVLGSGAAAFTLGSGQNSFLSAALVTAGITWLPRRPVLAGIMLGLLAFKPQLAMLVPVALASARAWRTLVAAGLTGAALLGASLVVPGVGLWRAWLGLFLSGDPAFHAWVEQGRLYGQSVFACARLAGLPAGGADAAQMAAILLSGLCVLSVFRRGSDAVRLAVFLLAIILAAPHVGTYDAIMVAEAVMLLLLQPGAMPRIDVVLAVAVWCSLSLQPPFVVRPAVITPLLVGALMVRTAFGARRVDTSYREEGLLF